MYSLIVIGLFIGGFFVKCGLEIAGVIKPVEETLK